LLLFISGFFAVSSFGQAIDPSNLLFQYLNLENGLPHNKVNAVSMDKDGFMWFGTNDGICRYDGFNLKNYPLSSTSGDQLRTPQISAIKVDSKGNLLIGTYSLFRYNYGMDRIERCDSLKAIGLMGRVYAIEEGLNGQIWIGAEKGLFSYNTDGDSVTAYPFKANNDLIILSLLFNDEKLWFGTRNDGLFVFDTRTSSFSKVPKFSLSKEVKDQVNCLYIDKKKVIWAGTQDNGIYKFNLTDSSLSHVYLNEKNNLSYRVRKIVNDKYGNIWVGCRLGIFFQRAGTDSLIQVKQIDRLTSKSRSNSIYDIFIDRNEIMWIGTFSYGVSSCDFKRKPFYLYNLSDEETLLFVNMINCLVEGDEDNVWIGTEESGLFYFNRRTLKFKQFMPDSKNKNSLAGVNVKSLARESDGNLWIGYYGSGLDYLDVKSGQIKHYKAGKEPNNTIASNSIRALLLDNNENLLIGTDKGVDILKKGSLGFRHLNLNNEVLTLHNDNKNQIWVGTAGDGIYRLNKEKLVFEKMYSEQFTTSIKAIHVDSKDNIWIGTNKGLFYVNSRNNSLFHFGLERGLPSNIVLDILEDKKNNLWVSTGAGLIKCSSAVTNPTTFNVKQYDIHDGLQGAEFRESASFINKKGEMYFGGVQGFNVFMPDSIKNNPYSPKLAFTQLKIFSKNVEIGDEIEGKIILQKAINKTQQLTLSYKHSQISIEFAALHFSNPANNKYKYRLSPLEKEWNISTGIRNFATYSNLQGGEYSFIVEAANSDGLWNPDPLILEIKVIPPFWKTWWFIGIIILVLIASALGFYLNRISLLKRYNAELEKKVEDRTRKLKESFDQVLEKQNFIEKQSEVTGTQFNER
jgi:ligand-binding sensor domain-containing protein